MRKKLLLRKAVTFSLMGVLAASSVLMARVNPGAVFSSEISSETQGTPDTPDAPDVPDIPDVSDAPDVSDVPDMPDVPDVSDVSDIPDVPSDSGSSSGGGSNSGSTITTSSSNVSSALDSVMVKGIRVFTTVAGRYSAGPVAGVIVTTPYSDVVATVDVGTNQKPSAVIENGVCGEDSKACMMRKLEELKPISPEVVSGSVLDIWLGISDINDNFTEIGKTVRPIEFKAGIPANFKTDGYDYVSIFAQLDGITLVIVDTDDDSDTMTFPADVYDTFILIKGSPGSFAAYR